MATLNACKFKDHTAIVQCSVDIKCVCLFDLILYVPSTFFSVM